LAVLASYEDFESL